MFTGLVAAFSFFNCQRWDYITFTYSFQSLTLLILIVNIEIHCFKGFYSLEPQKRERTFDFHFVRSLFLKVLYNL